MDKNCPIGSLPVVNELFDTFRKSWTTWGGEKIFFQGACEETGKGMPEGRIPALPIFVTASTVRKKEDLKHFIRIDEEAWHERPFLEKVKEHFCALFRKRL